MPAGPTYSEDMTMDEIMRLWPATIRVILDHHMMCVGCPIAPFHTVEEAIRAHGIDDGKFRAALADAMKEEASAAAGPAFGEQE